MPFSEIEVDLIGTAAAPLVHSGWSDWIERTVQVIKFEDEWDARRTTEIHFSMPDPAPIPDPASEWCFLPITRLTKQLFIDFRINDESGHAVHAVTSDDAARISLAALNAIAAAEANLDLAQDQVFQSRLKRIVARNPKDAQSAFNGLKRMPRKHPFRGLLSADVFLEVATLLRDHYLLFVQVPLNPADKTRRISFSFSHPLKNQQRDRLSWPTRFKRAVGLEDDPLAFTVPDLGDGGSHHLLVEAPENIQFNNRELEREAPVKNLTSGSQPGSASPGPYPITARASSPSSALFYVAPQPTGTSGTAKVFARPMATVLLIGGMITAWLTAALIAWLAYRAPQVTGGTTGAASTLLLVLFALLPVIVARPGEHSFTTRMYMGLRIAVLAPAFFTVVAASALVGDVSTCAAQATLAILAGSSGFVGILLTTTLFRCRAQPYWVEQRDTSDAQIA